MARSESRLNIEDDARYTSADGTPIPSATADPPRLQLPIKGTISGLMAAVDICMKAVMPTVRFSVADSDFDTDFSVPAGDYEDRRTAVDPIPRFQEAIVWEVIKQEPGTLNSGAFAGTRHIKPTPMERAKLDPRYSSDYVDVYTQNFDNIVQFNILAASNKRAEELTNEFRNLMVTGGRVWAEAGIDKIHFHRRFKDTRMEEIGSGLQNRSLQFYVRTQEQFILAKNLIEELVINVKAVINTVPEATGFFSGTEEY